MFINCETLFTSFFFDQIKLVTFHFLCNRDLSETSLSDLPTRGLSDLEVLRLVDTKTLKVIPSVYNFKVRDTVYSL